MNQERILAMVRQYGTPFYCFDTDVLKARLQYLKQALPKNTALCYAAKANTFLLPALEEELQHFEICSPGEYHICKKVGIPNTKIVLSGVYKKKEDLEALFQSQEKLPVMTIESVQQHVLIDTLSRQYNKEVSVLLRLTSGNQFGLDEPVLKKYIEQRENYPLIHIQGIQYFSGTQKVSQKRVLRELDLLETFLQELKEIGYDPDVLEYGPGFPVDYFSSMKWKEEEHLHFFAEALKRFGSLPVILELGRSIAASCGLYVTQVVDTKTNKSQNYALVDGGIHHLVYYGQGMAMKLPPYRFYTQSQGDVAPWNVCGALCTINDILMKQAMLSHPQPGDIFVFENTGAYCPTEGMSLFLTRDLPAVWLVDSCTEKQVRDFVSVVDLNAPRP